MHILFADKFPETQLKTLQDAGHQTHYEPGLPAEDLAAAIPGKEILVVRSTRVTQETIEAGEALSIIIRAGAGTNTIDKDSAARRGIPVCNVPGKNAVAVAELTMGLLLSIDRRIPDNVAELRAGKWDKKKFSAARGLLGQTLGIVGAGSIGMAVAERAFAFGLQIIMQDKPNRSEQILQKMNALQIRTVATLEELAAASDIVTVHVPALPATEGLISESFLSHMKAGAILLNTSRGDVVDEPALIAALDRKGLRAGLDVYAGEPGAAQGTFHSALAQHPSVYGTHHIGASTEQAQDAVAAGVLEIISEFEQRRVINQVN